MPGRGCFTPGQLVSVLEKQKYVCFEVENEKLKFDFNEKVLAIKEQDWNKGIREPRFYSVKELKCGDFIVEK